MERMPNRLSIEALKDTKKNTKEKTALGLNLIQQERIGDLLFLIGTMLAFTDAAQGEAAILETQQAKKQNLSDAAIETLNIGSWIFLVASIIFAGTAIVRLEQLKAENKTNKSTSDQELLYGNEVATFGSIIKVIGFTVTAVGNQIKYNSTQRK